MSSLQCKASYFASLAQYQRSIADANAAKYGDALTRLTQALESAKEASRFASHFHAIFAPGPNPTLPADSVANLNEMTKTHQTLVSAALAVATKENDLIYHAKPTSDASLPTLDKTSVAEPVPIQEIYSNPEVQKIVGPDIFIKLVPLSVHESASMYSEEKAKLVRKETEVVDLADGELQATLEYLDLPGSLRRLQSGESASLEPTPGVMRMSSEVGAQERSTRTTELINTITSLKGKCSNELDRSAQELAKEERDCEAARRQYPMHFDQQPSTSLPEYKRLRNEVKDRQNALQNASSSDSRVLSLWESCRTDIELLLDEAAVESTYAKMAGSGPVSKSSAQSDLLGDDELSIDSQETLRMKEGIQAVEKLNDRLYQLKKERREVLLDLKERVSSSLKTFDGSEVKSRRKPMISLIY